ncbi:putative caffeoyl-CoA O-methyltransferase At1g67980 [Carica papaya]|uniref:putative caffeoyl-CoA O-methyltransferase At1g67980 n=1 Tax=Carica papaya TaxID=3649 RepID=UPI000B8C6FC5|nr:putative caffeoyl-CoA O-methyltransferase At1g67980 [Carica papaya]
MASLPPKGILKTDSLLKYVYETSVYPREHAQLKQLREATVEKYPERSLMGVPVDEGQFLQLLLNVANAKKTLEIGVFTGYSLLATALALPPDGQITAIDINREAYEVGLPFIKEAGVEHKIDFIEADALTTLTHLLNHDNKPEFDFVFVDADKVSYTKYHEKLIELVKIGGLIAYDNTLWFGFVAEEEEKVPDVAKMSRKSILDFNKQLACDDRFQISQVSIGDGLTLCRRLY